jgi:hypothetical protein
MVAGFWIENFLEQIDASRVPEDTDECPFSGNFQQEHTMMRQTRIGNYQVVKPDEYYLCNSRCHGYIRVYKRDGEWRWHYFYS